jgi:hypothetical protein
MAKHKVSVVMNQLLEPWEVLKKGINHVLAQEGCDIQLIISSRERDSNIKLISIHYPQVEQAILVDSGLPLVKSPFGSFSQLNNALPLVKGDWFSFIGGDDFVYPYKYQMEINQCLAQGKEICYSACDLVTPLGKIIKYYPLIPYDRKRHNETNFVADYSTISRRLFNKYLPFKVEYNNYAFWDLWLRIYEGEGDVFTYNPAPILGYVQVDSSMHLIRAKSPSAIAEANHDRIRMFKAHNITVL